MDRRNFIKAVSVASTGMYCNSVLASHTQSHLSTVLVSKYSADNIQEAIHASFGSGFELLDYVEAGNRIHANVKDRENQYIVVSDDLADWQIHSATTM